MVRREKSPEVIEDVILFVVWIPYPLNPNWVYEEDLQGCAKWVAEVIGNEDYLQSIHQKPSSRGMILLEISKEFKDHGRLLGEHQWCNFLKDASEEEEGHKTCVYYSIYRTCREARKDGWNPITIPTRWFKTWSPGIDRFVSPYPEPRHCLPPPEDRTSKQICRYIPLGISAPSKPIPPKADGPPVVGSSAWITQQKEKKLNSESTVVAWGKQGEGDNATTANFAVIPSLLQDHMKETSIVPDNSEPFTPRFKPRPVPLQKFMSQPQVPHKRVQVPTWVGHSTSSPSSSIDQKQSTKRGPPTKPQNAWAKPLKIIPIKPATITTGPDSTKTWESSTDSWADIVDDETANDTTTDESTFRKIGQPLTSGFNLKGLKSSLDEVESSPIPSYTTCQDSDDECDLEDILAPRGDFRNDSTMPIDEPSQDIDRCKGWSDAEEYSEKKEQEILCPTHGPACSKKICQDYQKLDRERKREETRKSGQWQGRSRGRGRGRGRGRWAFTSGGA